MANSTPPLSLRLPKALVVTVLPLAIATASACSSNADGQASNPDTASNDAAADQVAVDDAADAPATSEASEDVVPEAMREAGPDIATYDAPIACESGGDMYCVPATLDAGNCNVFVCGSECPEGCEPYA